MVVGGLDKVKIGEPSKADDVICTSSVALGNGALKDIKNIIFVDPKMFDASKSMQIAKEIEKMNALIDDDEKYILIGPGRWGSSDPWLGIPVEWDQISKAKIIIEYGMESFPVDPSFGSHFFQNVTSMRLGYFTINHKKKEDYLDLDWMLSQKKKRSKKYTSWIELKNPIAVNIDGQAGKGEIIKFQKEQEESMDEHETSGI